MTNPLILPGAEPFFYPGNRSGVLLIHGYTGTPFEMRDLGKYLNQQGYTVVGVRLAGHGTKIKDMNRSHWQDWLASVEDGWNLLKSNTDRIYVGGLSMGGILALLFSSRFPVAGTMALAAPHHLPDDLRIKYIDLLKLFISSVPKGGESDWFDKAAETEHVSYSEDSANGVKQLKELIRTMQAELHKVTNPLLLLYSKNDALVRAEENHIDQIYDAVSSEIKEKLMIEGSGHVLTRDAKHQQVFETCADFLKRMEKKVTG